MGNSFIIKSKKHNLIELEQFSKKYSLNFVKVKLYHDDYEIFRIKTGGELPKDKMVKLFVKVVSGGDSTNNKDVDLYVNSLYRAFDRDNNGTISFEEFLIGYCLLNSKDERCKLKFAFKMYDLNRDNKIDKNELKTMSIAFANALKRNTDLLNDEHFMKALIKDLDTDRSGYVSEQEFIDGLIKNRLYRECLTGFI